MFRDMTPSVGHQHTEAAEGSRHLMQGPIVPEGEIWHLRLMAAKDNMDINERFPRRTVQEVGLCVWTPPPESEHEDFRPGTWVLLAGDIDLHQFEPVVWEGCLTLRPGSQFGAWFRGAVEGDTLELNALYDIGEERDNDENDVEKEGKGASERAGSGD